MTKMHVRNITGLPATLDKFDDFARQTVVRAMAEAGITVVAGSFEKGAVVTSSDEGVYQESTGKVYSWFTDATITVPTGTTPQNFGGVNATAWVDRTGVTLRAELADPWSTVVVGGVAAPDIAKASYVMFGAIATSYYMSDPAVDYTQIMQSLADSGLKLYVNHGFLAKITTYINFDSLFLDGDKSSGFLLDSQTVDAIFKPKSTAKSFVAMNIKAEAMRYNHNRPYLCSTDDGSASPLTHYEVVGCNLHNIGESAEVEKSEHTAISMYNVITSDDLTDSYCSGLETSYPRAWQRYQVNFTDESSYGVATERFGSYISAFNNINVFGQSGDNKDLAKYSGLSERYTINSNTYTNRNLASDSEVDTFMGLCFATVSTNKFKNVSIKTMKALNSGNPSLSGVALMSSITDNTLHFEQGSQIDKGILAKPDLCSYIGNKIMYRCTSDVTNFSGFKIELPDTNTYFGLNPTCNVFIGNLIDVTCGTTSYIRKPVSGLSILRGSVCSGNIFIGGSVSLSGDRGTLLSSNTFVNTAIDGGVNGRLDAAFSGGSNTFLTQSGGTFTDSSEFTVSLTNNGGFMTGSFAAPWYSDDRREWEVSIRTTTTNGTNNWQTFRTKANPNSQSIVQSSGRLPLSATDAPAKENIFGMSVTSSAVTLTTTTAATVYYPTVISVKCKPVN